MKKLTTLFLISTVAFSSFSFAGGSKGSDPLKQGSVIIFDGGSKGSDPGSISNDGIIVADGGSKGSDPNRGGSKGSDPRGGSKGSDPSRDITATDSGYPTLMALLSKYFSI